MQAGWGQQSSDARLGGKTGGSFIFMCLYIIWIHMLALFHHIRRCRLLLASPLSFDSEEQGTGKVVYQNVYSNLKYGILRASLGDARIACILILD